MHLHLLLFYLFIILLGLLSCLSCSLLFFFMYFFILLISFSDYLFFIFFHNDANLNLWSKLLSLNHQTEVAVIVSGFVWSLKLGINVHIFVYLHRLFDRPVNDSRNKIAFSRNWNYLNIFWPGRVSCVFEPPGEREISAFIDHLMMNCRSIIQLSTGQYLNTLVDFLCFFWLLVFNLISSSNPVLGWSFIVLIIWLRRQLILRFSHDLTYAYRIRESPIAVK